MKNTDSDRSNTGPELLPEQKWAVPLPPMVQWQAKTADAWIEAARVGRELNPPNGRPKRQRPFRRVVVITGDSLEEVDQRTEQLARALGNRTRGNGRWARPVLYHDLLKDFSVLRGLGITLPRNKSLSAEACRYGLGETLRKHGYTTVSPDGLRKNGTVRQRLANALSRVFEEVASFIENTPAEMPKP